MGILCMRASAELDRFMARGKVNVEPSDKGVDKVVSASLKAEWNGESEFGGSDGVQVDGEYGSGVGHDGFEVDGIYEGL